MIMMIIIIMVMIIIIIMIMIILIMIYMIIITVIVTPQIYSCLIFFLAIRNCLFSFFPFFFPLH